jgi:hypothetical protein
MSSNLQRFLGGSPGTVLVKLVFLSLLVGLFMSLLGITPMGIVRGITRFFDRLASTGLGALKDVGGWLIYGAMVVVPLWLLTRIFASRR